MRQHIPMHVNQLKQSVYKKILCWTKQFLKITLLFVYLAKLIIISLDIISSQIRDESR